MGLPVKRLLVYIRGRGVLLIISKTDGQTDGWTVGRTDGRYQAHYLPASRSIIIANMSLLVFSTGATCLAIRDFRGESESLKSEQNENHLLDYPIHYWKGNIFQPVYECLFVCTLFTIKSLRRNNLFSVIFFFCMRVTTNLSVISHVLNFYWL